MSVIKYKDPNTGEVKKVGFPKMDLYDKGEVDDLLKGKANAEHAHTKSQITDFAHSHDMTDVNGLNSALSEKASAADVYTKTESDTLLSKKANASVTFLPDGTDFNSILQTGSYKVYSETNSPSGAAAYMVTVIAGVNGSLTQLAISYHPENKRNRTFTRTRVFDSWEEWKELATTSMLCNPNLLDNWYFGNPVDQRQGRVVKPNTTYYSDNQLTTSAGTTSAYVTAYRYATGTANGVNYASFKLEDKDTAPTYYAAPENVVRGYTGSGYGIDRWKGYDSGQVILIYNDHISIKHGATNGIIEFLDNGHFASLSNKTMTLSFLLMNNILLVYTFTTGSSEWWYNTEIDGYRIEFGHTATPYVMITSANDIDVKAAKLELGDTQTLAHQDSSGNWVLNELPDYGEQLARCMAYAVQLDKNGGIGIVQNETTAYVTFPLSVPLKLRSGVHPVINQNYPASAWTTKGTTTITNAVLNDNYNGKQVLCLTVIGDFSGVQSGSVITSYLFAPFISNDL